MGRDLDLLKAYTVGGKISIHTPAWGVTNNLFPRIRKVPHFNPHARVGRDESSLICFLTTKYFNPHARVGRDTN